MSGAAKRLHVEDGIELFYRDYAGPEDAVPAICLHGLTRNSRDFEELAPLLASDRRVLALDFRGRGHSTSDPDWRRYQPATYCADTVAVMEHANISRAVFIGTSLGGLVSMIMAARHPERVAGVLLNDIGPEIAPEGLARISTYCGTQPPVSDWSEAVLQARETYGDAWPGLSDATWHRLVRRNYRETEEGAVQLDMDPEIGRAIREAGTELGNPWDLFDALENVPTLVLRGALSDILAPATVDAMRQRKPDLQAVEVPNRGHVPLLDEPESVRAIQQFLSKVT